MLALPIAEREMRINARRLSTYRSRWAVAALAATSAICVLYAGLADLVAPSSAGRGLFWALAAIGYLFAVFEGALLTADSLSVERREGTLGLLFLTPLSPTDIVCGKWFSSVNRSAYSLMAALPVPGLAIFVGGVTLKDLLFLMAATLNALLFCAALGVCVSSYERSGSRAYIKTLGLVCMSALLWPAVVLWLHAEFGGSFAAPLLTVTPAGPMVSALDFGSGKLPAPGFWTSLATTQLLCWSFLFLAGQAIDRGWKDSDRQAHRLPLYRRLFLKPKAASATNRRSKPRRPRNPFLDRNPIVWLAERSARPGGTLIALAVTVIPVDLLLLMLSPTELPGPPMLAINNLLLHLICGASIFNQTCRGVIKDRKTGALELLLTTRLSPDDFLDGRALALIRRFLPVFAALALNDLALLGSLWFEYPAPMAMGCTAAAVTLMALEYPSHLGNVWLGQWYGFTCPSAAAGQRRGALVTTAAPLCVCLFTLALWGGVTGGRGFSEELILIGGVWYLCLVVIFSSGLIAYTIGRLRDDFRSLALPAGTEIPSHPSSRKDAKAAS